jgi:hypothetical protein
VWVSGRPDLAGVEREALGERVNLVTPVTPAATEKFSR